MPERARMRIRCDETLLLVFEHHSPRVLLMNILCKAVLVFLSAI